MTDVNARGLVINIHSEFRTALLNSKYYGWRLEHYRSLNWYMEILIAAGATGSGIAGLAVWQSGAGAAVWGIISATSIVLATLKPIIDWSKKIEHYTKLSTSYSKLYESYRIMEQQLFETGLTPARVDEFTKLRLQMVELAPLDDKNPKPDRVAQFTSNVNREIPAASLWMPPAEAPKSIIVEKVQPSGDKGATDSAKTSPPQDFRPAPPPQT